MASNKINLLNASPIKTTAREVDFHPSLGAPNFLIEISTVRQSCMSLGHFLASFMNIHMAQHAFP